MYKHFDPSDDPFYNLNRVISATECTGLIPRGETDEEAEKSAALYSIHAPAKQTK